MNVRTSMILICLVLASAAVALGETNEKLMLPMEHSIERAPAILGELAQYTWQPGLEDLRGSEGFGIDAYPGENLVHWDDIDSPGTWDIVGSVADTQFFAGDFLNCDYSRMYLIDYGQTALYTINTETAATTQIGDCSPVSGQSWTGMTAAHDGTLYACSTNITTSYLYEVDPGTGTATVIGSGMGSEAPGIIDIAINCSGEMYGVCLVNDTLVQIDPETGLGTEIGDLNFDANYAQGMDFDDTTDTLYWAAYGASGQMRTIDTATGASTAVGAFPGGAEVDCLAIVGCCGPRSEGQIDLDYDMYQCEDTVNIVVLDADLEGMGTVDVNLASDSAPLGVDATLTEDMETLGMFAGSVTISASGAGELIVADADTLTGTYEDEDFGGMGPMTVTDTAGVDCSAPVISGVMVSELTSTSALIEWTTDEDSTSVVRYGTMMPPDMEMGDETYVTDHSILLEDLEPCTVYYFEVESADPAGATTIDDNNGNYYQFLTYMLNILFEENMDEDPGWDISGGQWAWGQPTGGGGYYGEPDPTSGYTGDNVYGYNLDGDYANSIPEYHLTTPAFDCSDVELMTLTFWRWLGVENNTWDHAYLSLSTDGGSTWTDLWQNGSSSMYGGEWEFEEYDLSSAAGYENVHLRWTMGTTDSSVIYCGWNIDDVLVSFEEPCGTPTPVLTATPTMMPGTPTMPPPTATPVPPTDTPMPPTATMAPATDTPIPPTATMEPTMAPPTDTPIPPTATEVPPTEIPTEIPPTPTFVPECTIFGVLMMASADMVHPGDIFWVKAEICNPGDPLMQQPFVAMMDIGIGEYWFYPTWVHYPPDFAYAPIDLPTGMTTEEVMPEFTWPDTGSTSFSGINIYGAVLTETMDGINGDIGMVTFGYGPS